MFDVERFNFRKLNELEVRTQYQIKFSNWFAALENLSDEEDINRAWENTKENIKSQLKTVWVCTNRSSINHVLMKSVYVF
jgi:hypothetical protein